MERISFFDYICEAPIKIPKHAKITTGYRKTSLNETDKSNHWQNDIRKSTKVVRYTDKW